MPEATAQSVELYVAPARLERWTANFLKRHGATASNVVDGALVGFAQDGSSFEARLPFGRSYSGPATTDGFLEAARPPEEWGLLLVRKGGFAVARLEREKIVSSKVGQRHVLGRSKAGGWSQQRFARRRDLQAQRAYEAAAHHTEVIIGHMKSIVVGGDRGAIDEVIALTGLKSRVVATMPDVREPRRGVFEEAAIDARSVRMRVTNAN
ncbi:MAG: acVLRF1 family peptidyl-tRNA hydrolase [Marmoricola sp.]